MKIALLGSFPVYPYRHKLPLYNERPALVTSWNVNLAKGLARLSNIEIHFFTNAPLWRTQVIEDEGVYIHFVGHPPKVNWLDNITQLQFSKSHFHKLLKELKPDIVHGIGTEHEYPYIAQSSKYPSIITVHGIMNYLLQKIPTAPLHLNRTFARFEKKVLRQANDIVCINPYVEELFGKLTKATFHHIPNPININFYEANSSEEYDIVHVAMISRLKRHLNLVKAVHQLSVEKSNVPTVVFVGDGDHQYKEEIQAYIRKFSLEKHFRFMGQLSQAETAKILGQAKVVAVPSIAETAPMVISEAMALGKPVVATRVGGIPYMVQEGKTGFLVPPDDIEALAQRIDLLLHDADLRKQFGNRAQALARNLYHPNTVAQQTLLVYQRILNRVKAANE